MLWKLARLFGLILVLLCVAPVLRLAAARRHRRWRRDAGKLHSRGAG